MGRGCRPVSRLLRNASLAFAFLVLVRTATAQEPALDPNAYDQARRAFKEERYRDAALGFEAAYRIRPDAIALYTAAQAWELALDPARAADAYARALGSGKLDENQTARARDRLAALGAELGAVDVRGPEGTRVTLDDHGEWPVPARLHGAPGARVLSIVHPDGAAERRPLTLAAGSVAPVDTLPPRAPAAAPVPQVGPPPVLPEPRKNPVYDPAPPSERSPVWLGVGFGSLGAGIGVLGGALLFGLAAEDADSAANAAPSAEGEEHADSLRTRALVMGVAGGALTALGTGIVIWQSTRSSSGEAALGVRLNGQRVDLVGRF
jgi:hypothetical protein